MESTENRGSVVTPGSVKLINLPGYANHSFLKWFLKKVEAPLEGLFAIDRINHIFQQIRMHHPADINEGEFFDIALRYLNIQVNVSASDLNKIPDDGPLVVVANHPFGGAEGMILGKLLFERRPDVKILGNYLLSHIPQIRPAILPVDPFGNKTAVSTNAAVYKSVVRWVRRGGALLTFPAGEVAHLQPRKGRITDPPWSPHIAGIIRMARARVLPVYFPGANTLLFNLLGLIHPRIRTLMLTRELINKENTPITVYIGKPISWPQMEKINTRRSLTDYLRFTTYFLKHRERMGGNIISLPKPFIKIRKNKKQLSPLAPSIPASTLCREIAALPKESLLVRHKAFEVYCGIAAQMPNVMHEIARLREISFREVDEGTGKSLDLDEFDEYYLQLFLWNREKRDIAGAYRLGITEDILSQRGPAGLYTHSLFRFKSEFIQNLHNSIELGRSFILPAYQRKHGCLSLLWRGIGEFVIRCPQFHILFGPVSISRNYHVVSRNLIVSFLRKAETDAKYTPWVKPRNPVAPEFIHRFKERVFQTPIGSIEDVSLLVSEIEKDGKGVPPLIKHYLKLDGKFIGFNVDRNFSNVVDGLVMVDLLRTDHRLLKRFMGDNGFKIYWTHHRSLQEKAA